MAKFKPPIIIWLFFAFIAVTITYFTSQTFFLFNFLYIGTFVAVGTYLFGQGFKYARTVVQFGVGL